MVTEGEQLSSVAKAKWVNRERVLVFCSRGTSSRDRHLMNDFKALMPHARSESKMDKKQSTTMINEICEMRNCNKCLYFESKKKKDLYLWASNLPRGPSAKFLVHNVRTMDELKLSGNCLKGSRPILSFDKTFDEQPHWALLKEMFIQLFGTPNHHPQSQPFIDHIFTFAIEDNKIWFRNYQIVDETGKLEEIGPRMVLEVARIFEGSFSGAVLYENPDYTSPNDVRRRTKEASGGKYTSRVQAKKSLTERRKQATVSFKTDPLDDIFETGNGEQSQQSEPAEVRNLKRQLIKKKIRTNKRRKVV